MTGMQFVAFDTLCYPEQEGAKIHMGINETSHMHSAYDERETLTEAGSGLGSFLTAIQNPVVDIVLALGIFFMCL